MLLSFLVYERGVYTFWSQKGVERLNAEDAISLIEIEEPVIIDVRSEEEYQVSHMDEAKRYSPEIIEKLNPNDPILVYCTASVRSNSLAKVLVNLGFTHIYELKGGLLHWKNQGYPLVRTDGNRTDSLHTYSSTLAPFLRKGTAVY